MNFPTRILTVILMSVAVWASRAETSALWGTNGERWSAGGRLPDFSFAGYHCGEAALPQLPMGVSVRAFGAKGDGQTDDTLAFQAALAAVTNGAIEIPPGRYIITNILEIRHSGVVLRGAGPGKTTLYFPRPLQAIRPDWSATTTGKRTSEYSWAGGEVWFKGGFGGQTLTVVSAPAVYGANSLTVESTGRLQVGQRVEIYEKDNLDNSLAADLYSGDPGKTENLKGSTHASMVCHITKLDGEQVEFDRPLRFDVQLKWHPEIRRFAPTVCESGVENLGFEFPNTRYPGHFNEMGYNALAFSGVADCWARNLVISNADSGIFPNGRFCTITKVVLATSREPDAVLHCTGHHGCDIAGEDNLFTGLDYRMRFIHDISVEHCAAGNVVAQVRGVDLCLDHHVCAPYENLFTDIDAGAGTRLWFCGGGAGLGKHGGRQETFWNIRTVRPQKLPPADFGPLSMIFVGLHSDLPSQTDESGCWFENVPEIIPADLHAAQLERRLAER